MKKLIALAVTAAGCVLSAGAHAGNVYWSVGIDLPPVGTVISNAPPPVYAPVPVYAPPPVVVPAPVYVPAPPVYVAPPRVVYRPRPVYVPAPVVYQPVPVVAYPQHRRGGWRGHRHEHRDEYGTVYRDRDGRWDDERRHRHDRRDRYDGYR